MKKIDADGFVLSSHVEYKNRGVDHLGHLIVLEVRGIRAIQFYLEGSR